MQRRGSLASFVLSVLGAAGFNAAARDLDIPVTLDIAAASLESALLELSKQTGLQLVAPTGSLPTAPTQRITGSMSLGSALDLLLKDTELTYRLVGDRTLTIIPRSHSADYPDAVPSVQSLQREIDAPGVDEEAIRLASRHTQAARPQNIHMVMATGGDDTAVPQATDQSSEQIQSVVIRAQREDEASAEQGYRAKTVSQLGVLGAKAIEDAPFSINVVPPELIENRMAAAPDELIRINPVAQLESPQARFFTSIILRGFNVASDNQIDGMRNGYYTAIDIEDKERIEIMTGLSAFLYGVGNVGGTVNYVLKRPTAEARRSFNVGNLGGDNYFAHVDIGGPIDSAGRFGYRLNVMRQDGDTFMDYQSLSRNLVSAAFDWNVSESAKFQIDASWADSDMRGAETFWFPLDPSEAGLSLYQNVPDTSVYYGQPQSYTKAHREHVAGRFLWDINDRSTLRASISHRTAKQDLLASLNLLIAGGNYWPLVFEWEYPDVEINAAYLFADTRFKTGSMEHRLTGGFFGDEAETTNFRNSGSLLIVGDTNVSDPLYIDEAPPPPVGPKFLSERSKATNFVLGDEVSIGDWTALVGLTHTSLKVEAFPGPDTSPTVYDQSETTPAVTLLHHVNEGLRIYGNYMKSFEQGSTAAGLDGAGRPVVNAGEIMPPLNSKQLEFGAKYAWGNTLLTAALFEIDKPLEIYVPVGVGQSRLEQDGRQVHRGGEFTVSGRVAERLALVGGVTVLDAKIKENAANPELEGSTPINVAERQIKLYGEYDLAAVPGLTFTAGVYHTGEQELVAPNTYRAPSFTTGDVGIRYSRQLWGDRKLTLRMNVNNVTDENYWLNSTYMGTQRNVTIGAQIVF